MYYLILHFFCLIVAQLYHFKVTEVAMFYTETYQGAGFVKSI